MEEVCFFATQLSAGDCMAVKVGRLQSEIHPTFLQTLYPIYLIQNLFYILNSLAGLLLKSLLPALRVSFRNVVVFGMCS
jgi:hypothetical protein